jgi:MFS family permease
MRFRWFGIWVLGMFLAALLAPGCLSGFGPRATAVSWEWLAQEIGLLLITVGMILAPFLMVLALSLDYSPALPSRGDLEYLAELKRRWASLPQHVPGCAPRAKPRAAKSGRFVVTGRGPAALPRDDLGWLVAIKRCGAWNPPATARP